MTVVALALPSLKLSEHERESARSLRGHLQTVRHKNQAKSDLYEGKTEARDLGIAAPAGLPELINAVMGWPGTVVDVLEERLEFRGWTGLDPKIVGPLQDLFDDNELAVEAGRGHLDALIYGINFVTVGAGDTSIGEPEVLVSVESTESCTMSWSHRARRATSALSQTRDAGGVVTMETLYLPDETIRFERVRGEMVVIDRNHHGLGRVPVARMLNRDRASDTSGRSEITRPVVYYTTAGVRTLSGLEVNREFYTSPKWTALNTDPAVFDMGDHKTPEENRAAAWRSTAGFLNAIPPQVDDDNNPVKPELHEFRPASPQPYIDQIKAYSQLLAAESGIPAPYLGFVTDNPSSADSIRQQEYRLVKRAERRQVSFGLAWREVARLALELRGDFDQAAFRKVGVSWRDASTPTRAAAADEAQKLISSGVLKPASSVTFDRLGFSTQEQNQLADELRTDGVAALVEAIRGDGGSSPAEEAAALKTRFEALGVAIRAGVDPVDAARRIGLEGVKFTGAIPVALRPPAEDAARLEDR